MLRPCRHTILIRRTAVTICTQHGIVTMVSQPRRELNRPVPPQFQGFPFSTRQLRQALYTLDHLLVDLCVCKTSRSRVADVIDLRNSQLFVLGLFSQTLSCHHHGHRALGH